MYARLFELADRRGAPLPAPRLRYLSSGGAPLDIGLKQRVEAMWGLPLNNGYGLTEASPTVATTRVENPANDDSVGPPLPNVELRIADPATGRALSARDIGEIWVRGPGVMKGYYAAPEETAKTITSEGWLKTGDLGRLDAAGNLYVVGRLKELIIRSGFNVYPPEVEAVLSLHPDVGIAAVVGKKVEGNEEVVAFLEPKPGRTIDTEAVRAIATERLAPYKRPSRYVVQALPVSSAGKIRKAELARLVDGL
jgi:long-chain acyl-CoA synthetase